MALGHGIPVDWAEGTPLETPSRPGLRNRGHLEALYNRSLVVQEALADPTGHAVLDEMIKVLANRLLALADADPQCQVLLALAKTLGIEVTLGRKAAEALMTDTLGVRPG